MKALVKTFEDVDTDKYDPFMRLIVLKTNYKFLSEIIDEMAKESEYEPTKYIALMEMAADMGFESTVKYLVDFMKENFPREWFYYLQSQKPDTSAASDQDNR